MARGCHGRFKKPENKKTGRKQLRTEELGEIWLRRRKLTRVVMPNDDDDDDDSKSLKLLLNIFDGI